MPEQFPSPVNFLHSKYGCKYWQCWHDNWPLRFAMLHPKVHPNRWHNYYEKACHLKAVCCKTRNKLNNHSGVINRLVVNNSCKLFLWMCLGIFETSPAVKLCILWYDQSVNNLIYDFKCTVIMCMLCTKLYDYLYRLKVRERVKLRKAIDSFNFQLIRSKIIKCI